MTASILAFATLLAVGAAQAHDDLVPLNIKLPAPAFIGTPSDLPAGTTVEKPTGKPRPLLLVPPGVANLALGKPVTCGSTNVPQEALKKLTDGDKESRESSLTLLRKGAQWVQVDLGASHELFALVFWHNHGHPQSLSRCRRRSFR